MAYFLFLLSFVILQLLMIIVAENHEIESTAQRIGIGTLFFLGNDGIVKNRVFI